MSSASNISTRFFSDYCNQKGLLISVAWEILRQMKKKTVFYWRGGRGRNNWEHGNEEQPLGHI
jgi:hypothetical protein